MSESQKHRNKKSNFEYYTTNLFKFVTLSRLYALIRRHTFVSTVACCIWRKHGNLLTLLTVKKFRPWLIVQKVFWGSFGLYLEEIFDLTIFAPPPPSTMRPVRAPVLPGPCYGPASLVTRGVSTWKSFSTIINSNRNRTKFSCCGQKVSL